MKVNYVLRLLISKKTESDLNAQLKLLDKKAELDSHIYYTLLCTNDNKSAEINEIILPELKKLLKKITFTAKFVVSVAPGGSNEDPMWAVRLSPSKEKKLRKKLGRLLDVYMCKERDGVQYLWNRPSKKYGRKILYLPLGKGEINRKLAEQLIGISFKLSFEKIDYVQIREHELTASVDFEQSEATTSIASYSGGIFVSNKPQFNEKYETHEYSQNLPEYPTPSFY